MDHNFTKIYCTESSCEGGGAHDLFDCYVWGIWMHLIKPKYLILVQILQYHSSEQYIL